MKKKGATKFNDDLEKSPTDLVTYLDLALEGANLGIWDWYLEDNSVRFDRRWAEMLGLNFDTIKMELATWESRVHPDDLESAYADIKAYMDGKTDRYENIHRMKHADGHWVYILDRGRFSDWDENGKPTRFTGTHFDVTATEQNRKKLSIFFEKSPFGYAFCDMDGNLLEINKRYSEITGYSLEELKKLSYWDITPKKYEAGEARQIESMKETGRYGPYRKEYIQKNGVHIPVELNGFVIEDYDGVTGIWSTVEDITEKKALESQVSHNSKLASIGVLAAGVAHEINNPLAIIKILVENMIQISSEGSKQFSDLSKIDSAVERITKIVDGLRTFSKSDGLKTEIFDFHKALGDSLEIMEGLIKKEGFSLELDAQNDTDVFISGNKGKLQQVILNLLSNAKDAIKGKPDGKVKIKTFLEGDEVHIEVKDNGTGITEDNLDKIFDPFFTTKDINEGTGIGLSIVYNIVKEHQGQISVKSQAGKGTTFTVTLPVTHASMEEVMKPIAKKNSAKENRPILKGTVLLVEDEPDFRELVGDIIESTGLNVVACENGRVALETYNADPLKFDLIVSDIVMSEMGGPELLEVIYSNSGEPKPKFIFITGGVDLDLGEFAKNHVDAISGFFYKPFSAEIITKKLIEVFGQEELKLSA